MYDKNNFFWNFMHQAGYTGDNIDALKEFGFGDEWAEETAQGLREYENDIRKN